MNISVEAHEDCNLANVAIFSIATPLDIKRALNPHNSSIKNYIKILSKFEACVLNDVIKDIAICLELEEWKLFKVAVHKLK